MLHYCNDYKPIPHSLVFLHIKFNMAEGHFGVRTIMATIVKGHSKWSSQNWPLQKACMFNCVTTTSLYWLHQMEQFQGTVNWSPTQWFPFWSRSILNTARLDISLIKNTPDWTCQLISRDSKTSNVCQIREPSKPCSVGGSSGPGLGTTALHPFNSSKLSLWRDQRY